MREHEKPQQKKRSAANPSTDQIGQAKETAQYKNINPAADYTDGIKVPSLGGSAMPPTHWNGVKSPSLGGTATPVQKKQNQEEEQLTQQKPIQKKNSGLPEEVQAKMETSMGHDFSSVNIHKDSQNATDAGALAYAQGNDVHFAPGQFKPDTTSGQELIGHELAHVVQQREGRVQPTKMLGKGMAVNDDPSLEREADDMGKKAARGSTALQMRRSLRGTSAAKGNALQMKPETDFGEFKTTTYEKVTSGTKDIGAKIELEFHPNKKVDAEKVALTQTVRGYSNGNNDTFSPTRANRQTADGTYIDRVNERNNPIYGGQQLGAKEDISKTNDTGGNFKLGKKDKAGKWSPAYLYDRPSMPYRENNSGQIFETAALAIAGKQQNTYYGSVKWGWQVDAKGKYSLLPLSLVSKGDPSAKFQEAAKKWNAATSLGTIKTTGDPTQVYSVATSPKKLHTLKKDTVVTIDGGGYNLNGIPYNKATDPTGKVGLIKTADLRDQADGDATANLPIPSKTTKK